LDAALRVERAGTIKEYNWLPAHIGPLYTYTCGFENFHVFDLTHCTNVYANSCEVSYCIAASILIYYIFIAFVTDDRLCWDGAPHLKRPVPELDTNFDTSSRAFALTPALAAHVHMTAPSFHEYKAIINASGISKRLVRNLVRKPLGQVCFGQHLTNQVLHFELMV
jgi:hypothetical protein